MQYSEINGYHISKLTLGTVALGMDYGIANKQGKPDQYESYKILSAACKAGINTLDTARTYRDAEQIIGDFLKQNEKPRQVNVVTKFKISPTNIFNKEHARTEVYNSLKASRSLLKLASVPFCLFHMDRKLPVDQVLEILPAILTDLKHDGIIDVGGISVDHPAETALFIKHPVIEAIQVPMNVFDLRLVKNEMVQRMHEANKMVFIRSVFLQGLFFMAPGELTGNLFKAAKYIEALQNLAKQADMSIAQMAFSYIWDMEGISSIVFGAVNAAQVKQNIDLLQGNAIDNKTRESIETLFADMPEDIITPGLWSL
jgi:aryl-alcohol dehydrogenase-like predicted oxidoreductase